VTTCRANRATKCHSGPSYPSFLGGNPQDPPPPPGGALLGLRLPGLTPSRQPNELRGIWSLRWAYEGPSEPSPGGFWGEGRLMNEPPEPSYHSGLHEKTHFESLGCIILLTFLWRKGRPDRINRSHFAMVTPSLRP
jgi:hypothetical protein